MVLCVHSPDSGDGFRPPPAVLVRDEQWSAAAPKTRTPGSAAVVEGDLITVGVRERESAAERPVDGR